MIRHNVPKPHLVRPHFYDMNLFMTCSLYPLIILLYQKSFPTCSIASYFAVDRAIWYIISVSKKYKKYRKQVLNRLQCPYVLPSPTFVCRPIVATRWSCSRCPRSIQTSGWSAGQGACRTTERKPHHAPQHKHL